MDKILNVEIITPQKIIYSDKAQSVTLPGSMKPFQVLFNHAPIVSSLDLGVLKILDYSDKTLLFAASSGIVEVLKNNISILVESAIDGATVDFKKVSENLVKLKEANKASKTKEESGRIKTEIKYAENTLKASGKLN